jgi:hypothetical protein
MHIRFTIEGLDGATLHRLKEMTVEPGKVVPVTALVRVPSEDLTTGVMPVIFKGEVEGTSISLRYKSMFMGPK